MKRLGQGRFLNFMRKMTFWVLVASTSLLMSERMSYVLEGVEYQWLRIPMFVLFVSCFTWICVPFWIAFWGLIVILFRIDPLALESRRPLRKSVGPLTARTAIVMPVYNESSAEVFGALSAMYDEVARLEEGPLFDFFVLSDTRVEPIAKREVELWNLLKSEGRDRLFYRRRVENRGKKAGNIEDFVRSWGAHYEHLLILDADSLMTADTIRDLALVMQSNPQAGIIQTSPSVVLAETLFARLIQFTSRLYGTLFSHGAALWHGASSNYWGHNAIIRMKAFRDHCGLGDLPGEAPFGGPILSHDFVEAALLSAEDWGIYMAPSLSGSYEQIPPTPVEFLQRDKRWSQGNMQHLSLLLRPKLTTSSRTFFLFGALAYISSPLWLLLILLSTLDRLLSAIRPHQYFSQAHQLFPNWPISRGHDAIVLFSLTCAVLLTPKIGGMLVALGNKKTRWQFGGVLKLLISVLLETSFFVLFAPTMMMFHSYFVFATLRGKSVTWNTQNRSSEGLSFYEAWKATGWITLIAAAWIYLLVALDPKSILWMAPVMLGLLISPLLIWLASSPRLGKLSAKFQIFATPEELDPPPLFKEFLDKSRDLLDASYTGPDLSPRMPEVVEQDMPVNPIFR